MKVYVLLGVESNRECDGCFTIKYGAEDIFIGAYKTKEEAKEAEIANRFSYSYTCIKEYEIK